jgi:hypothetical protein
MTSARALTAARRARALALAAALLASFALSLAPSTLIACPSCATRGGPGTGTYVLIASLVALPYGIVVVVLRIVRRLDRRE